MLNLIIASMMFILRFLRRKIQKWCTNLERWTNKILFVWGAYQLATQQIPDWVDLLMNTITF